MKYTKKYIAVLLHNQSNVNATSGELVQFFNSNYYNPEEEDEGNIIEDFFNFLYDNVDYDLIKEYKNKI